MRKRNSCSPHHYFMVCLVMAGLKSFLYGIAPILGVTGAILYERQRALVSLGVLKAEQGRGPGSGVPLSAENVAAVIISLLAAGSLSEVDERVVALCKAQPSADALAESPSHFRKRVPDFRSEVARVLSGQPTHFRPAREDRYEGIRVSRWWRGQIMIGIGRDRQRSLDYFVADDKRSHHAISVTAEAEGNMFYKLVDLTLGALSPTVAEGDGQ